MISVVIPNYNNSRFIGNAIRSVLSQTYKRFLVIVVDDGSTDDSRKIVESFGDKVRYIWQENKGLGGARNTGILVSNTEFVGLLDADDEWRPNYLEKMMLLAERNPEAVVYFSGAQGMDSDGNDLPQIFGRPISSNGIYQTLLRANFIIPSTVIFRRDVITKAGLFDEENRELHGCEDWDLWLRLAPSYPFAGTTEALIRYRLHPQTFSANPTHMQGAVKTVIEKNFGSDDGEYRLWSNEKRRAFGGVYRFHALTSIQKQGNWEMAAEALRKAFEIDPDLVFDLDLFYELAFGSQPPGYRETAEGLNLEQNDKHILDMLENVFKNHPPLIALRKIAFGTASFATGLVAYNTEHWRLSRKFMLRTIAFWPKASLVAKAFFTLVKTYLNLPLIRQLKQFVFKGIHADSTG